MSALAAPAPDAAAPAHDGHDTRAHAPCERRSRRRRTAPCRSQDARTAKAELGYVIETRVVSPDGKPSTMRSSGSTTSSTSSAARRAHRDRAHRRPGNASLSYLPASTGSHDIAVRFAGQGSLVPSVGTATFEATLAAPPNRSDEPALLGFTRLVPYAAGAIVLSVWGLIAFALFGTARGIARTRGQDNRKGGHRMTFRSRALASTAAMTFLAGVLASCGAGTGENGDVRYDGTDDRADRRGHHQAPGRHVPHPARRHGP